MIKKGVGEAFTWSNEACYIGKFLMPKVGKSAWFLFNCSGPPPKESNKKIKKSPFSSVCKFIFKSWQIQTFNRASIDWYLILVFNPSLSKVKDVFQTRLGWRCQFAEIWWQWHPVQCAFYHVAHTRIYISHQPLATSGAVEPIIHSLGRLAEHEYWTVSVWQLCLHKEEVK